MSRVSLNRAPRVECLRNIIVHTELGVQNTACIYEKNVRDADKIKTKPTELGEY